MKARAGDWEKKEGKVELKVLGERTTEEEVKGSGAEAPGLEKQLQVLRGLIDVEDGSVAVGLPNLGTQHVFILSSVFIAGAYLGGDLLQHVSGGTHLQF